MVPKGYLSWFLNLAAIACAVLFILTRFLIFDIGFFVFGLIAIIRQRVYLRKSKMMWRKAKKEQ